jgi:hypothetical protein
MTTFFSEDELHRLNVDPGALGTIERLPIPTPRVDEGRGSFLARRAVEHRAWLSDTAEGLEVPSRLPAAESVLRGLRVRSDVLEAIGVEARYDDGRQVIALSQYEETDQEGAALPPWKASGPMPPPAAPLRAHSRMGALDIPDRERWQVVQPDRGATVRLSLLDTFRFVIAAPGGLPLALGAIERGELRLQPVYPWPAPPLDEWVETVMDEDLKAFASRRQADRWIATTIAGMLARLQTAGTEAEARTRLAALRAGRDSSPGLKPRLWVRAFSPAQRDALERFARIRARSLASRLEALLERLDPATSDLGEQWRALCHERDDLEGVRVLLREAGAGARLEEALHHADASGRAARFSWPREIDVDDERLRRAALSNPGAWWGSTRYAVYLL